MRKLPLKKVFVVGAAGVSQGALLGRAALRGAHVKAVVRLQGVPLAQFVDPRLVFETREEAAELRRSATAYGRSIAGRGLSIQDAALHLVSFPGLQPVAA